MKLGRKFLIYAGLLHVLLIVLSLQLLQMNKYLFVVAEVLIVISLAVCVHLYRAFLKPMNLIAAGVESIKDQDFSTKFIGGGKGELGALIDIYNQMIDQLRNERIRQREQHYFLQRLIEATPLGVIILDLDGNIDLINPAGKLMLGGAASELVGRSITSFKEQPGSAIGSLQPGESRVVSINGIQTFRCQKSHFLDRGFSRHFILVEELTREILDTQRQAYEKVIRMMSHEINNSVGAINSILNSSLKYSAQIGQDDRADFEDAVKVAIERNVGLNRFMSNFADVIRIPAASREQCDLHKLLRAVHVLMSAECSSRQITWHWELSDGPLVIQADAQQMEQVLVNIIKNAVEAIDREGNITVVTSQTEPRELRIIDDGRGITTDQRTHLFTPFYSTKRDGQGIGLTLIREILINHGFTFNLETLEPGYTEFWIAFGR